MMISERRGDRLHAAAAYPRDLCVCLCGWGWGRDRDLRTRRPARVQAGDLRCWACVTFGGDCGSSAMVMLLIYIFWGVRL